MPRFTRPLAQRNLRIRRPALTGAGDGAQRPFDKKASIASRAASEPNSRADSAARSSPRASSPASSVGVQQLLPLGQPLRVTLEQVADDAVELGVQLGLRHGDGHQARVRGCRPVELLPRQQRPRGRPRRHPGQHGQRDDRRRQPETHLGERERRGVGATPRCRSAATMPMPPARTAPWTRATNGLGEATIRRCSSTMVRAPSSMPSPVASDRSAPEQNTLPAARTTTTRDVVVGLGPVDPVEHPGHEGLAQGVALGLVVEGDRRDAGRDVVPHGSCSSVLLGLARVSRTWAGPGCAWRRS